MKVIESVYFKRFGFQLLNGFILAVLSSLHGHLIFCEESLFDECVSVPF